MLSDDDQKLAKILFGLLKNATSQAVVKEFLRTKGIPVSAQNWDDLYEKRIEPALKDKKLALKDLRDLLQQVEEFGKQHSFLFQCTEERAIGLLSPTRIASIAAAEGLSGLFTHPLDLEMPDEATIVDIRLYRPDPQKTPVSLTIKVVESRDINRLSAVETDPATGELIRRYATTKKRAVNIVHLDHTGLLEFRIASQDNQAKKYSELLWVLKNKVRKFLPDDGFAEVSLRESPNKPSVMRESPQHLIRAAHEPDELFRL